MSRVIHDRTGKIVDPSTASMVTLKPSGDGIGAEGLKGQLYVPREFQGRGFRDIQSIWMSVTTLPLASNVQGKVDRYWKSIIDALWDRYAQESPEVEYVEREYPHGETPPGMKAIVALSGGYDSTSTLLSLIDCGFEVTAFNVNGINKSAYNSSEAAAAKAICEKLGVRFVHPKVVNSIECAHLESPIKNFLIYNMMMAEAERIGARALGFGIFLDDTIETTYCPSDAHDLFSKYYQYMRAVYFDHAIFYSRLKSEAMYLIHKYGLLTEIRSCMTPVRYFGQRRKQVAKKVPGVDWDMWHNCCFNCYKCVEAAMRAMDYGIAPDLKDVPNLYRHCEGVLANFILKHVEEQIEFTIYYRGEEWARKFLGANPDLRK